MAEQQQANPEAVEALARVLVSAGRDQPYASYNGPPMARSILADPGPLLEALAEASVLEVEEAFEWCDDRCSIRDHYGEECGHQCRQAADHGPEHKCVNGHTYPRASRHDDPIPRQHRLVSPWKPVSGDE